MTRYLPRVGSKIAFQRSFTAATTAVISSENLVPGMVTSFIDNEFVPAHHDGKSDSIYANLSPASGAALCHVQIPTPAQVDAAVRSSQNTFQEWSKHSSWADRGNMLQTMAQRLQKHQEELIQLEAMDTGIPISQIRVNHIPYAIQTLEYYASLATTGGVSGRTFEGATYFSFTRREPLGVCAAIGPWNYPLTSMLWKIGPALACGNTVIYKPSECTPLTAIYAASLFKDVLPPGILQILTGDAATAKQLVRHEAVRKVSITGSVETGIHVAKESASTLKHTTLELGGKSPLLVLDDCDLDAAVRVAVEGNFVNNGQVCSNCTRVYVQKSILAQFLERLKSRLESSVVVGHNMDEHVNVGPLIQVPRDPSRHYNRVMKFVNGAKQDSRVELIYGGRGYLQDGGYFVEATVFFATSNDVPIVREEVFGPVMTVLSFATDEEAVAAANDSPFGLAAGVMTNDLTRAHRVCNQLQAGTVWVNNWNICPVEVRNRPACGRKHRCHLD